MGQPRPPACGQGGSRRTVGRGRADKPSLGAGSREKPVGLGVRSGQTKEENRQALSRCGHLEPQPTGPHPMGASVLAHRRLPARLPSRFLGVAVAIRSSLCPLQAVWGPGRRKPSVMGGAGGCHRVGSWKWGGGGRVSLMPTVGLCFDTSMALVIKPGGHPRRVPSPLQTQRRQEQTQPSGLLARYNTPSLGSGSWRQSPEAARGVWEELS